MADTKPEDMTTKELLLHLLNRVENVEQHLSKYDQLIETGMAQVNDVLTAAEGNPLIRNMLGL